MNVNEYGVVFQIGVGYDISNATALIITFTKPSGALLVVQSPLVQVGNQTIDTPKGVFLANQYATYVFEPGDVDEAGVWGVRLTYQDATPVQLISAPDTFTVNP